MKMKNLVIILVVLAMAGVAQAATVYSEDFSTGTVGNLVTAAPQSWALSFGSPAAIKDADPLSTGGGNYAQTYDSGGGRAWKTGLSAAVAAETLGVEFNVLAGVQDLAGAAGGSTSDTGLVSASSVNVRRVIFQYHQDEVQNPGAASEKPGGWELMYNGTSNYNFGGIFAGGTGADDGSRYEFELFASLVPGVGLTASVTPVGGSATSVFIADAALGTGWYDDIDAMRIYADGSISYMAIDDISIIGIPEPASAALMGLGGLLMLRRRSQG